jgi:hypothetical protein
VVSQRTKISSQSYLATHGGRNCTKSRTRPFLRDSFLEQTQKTSKYKVCKCSTVQCFAFSLFHTVNQGWAEVHEKIRGMDWKVPHRQRQHHNPCSCRDGSQSRRDKCHTSSTALNKQKRESRRSPIMLGKLIIVNLTLVCGADQLKRRLGRN